MNTAASSPRDRVADCFLAIFNAALAWTSFDRKDVEILGHRLVKATEEAGSVEWTDVRRHFLRGRRLHPQDTPFALRAARLALALARNDLADVRPDEMKILDRARQRLPWLSSASESPSTPPSPTPIDAAAQSVQFQAAFAWPQKGRAGLPGRFCRGDVPVAVGVVDPLDYPIALGIPRLDRTFLDVRRGPDGWFRPVLEPGTNAPCSVERFSVACATGEAWRDSPFSPRSPLSSTLRFHSEVALDDYCESDPPTSGGDQRAFAEVEARTREAAAALAIIDGHVWIRIPEPQVVLHLSPNAESSTYEMHPVHVSWQAGRLLGLERPETFEPAYDAGRVPAPLRFISMSWPAACEPDLRRLVDAWNLALFSDRDLPRALEWRRAPGHEPRPQAKPVIEAVAAFCEACARVVPHWTSPVTGQRIRTAATEASRMLAEAAKLGDVGAALEATACLRHVFEHDTYEESCVAMADISRAMKRKALPFFRAVEVTLANLRPEASEDNDLIGESFAP